MIIDTFLFNNEFDMLDIHLAISNSYVDRWIALEADRTLSGLSKDFHLKNNIKKYKKLYGDKFEVLSINLEPDHPNRSYCETGMRTGFKDRLDLCHAEDIIIHGDLDEILNPIKIREVLNLMDEQNKPVSCGLEMYMYKFDQKLFRGWKGNVAARRRMFETPHDLYKGDKNIVKRKNRGHCVSLGEPVGWHWSWFGTDDIIKNKVVSCIETDYRDPDQILEAFKKNDTISAINHKAGSEIITPNYPIEVLEILKKYPSYWHNPPTV